MRILPCKSLLGRGAGGSGGQGKEDQYSATSGQRSPTFGSGCPHLRRGSLGACLTPYTHLDLRAGSHRAGLKHLGPRKGTSSGGSGWVQGIGFS
jgi:hypothetical protein